MGENMQNITHYQLLLKWWPWLPFGGNIAILHVRFWTESHVDLALFIYIEHHWIVRFLVATLLSQRWGFHWILCNFRTGRLSRLGFCIQCLFIWCNLCRIIMLFVLYLIINKIEIACYWGNGRHIRPLKSLVSFSSISLVLR